LSETELAQALLEFAEGLEQKPIPAEVIAPAEAEPESRRVRRRPGRQALANFEKGFAGPGLLAFIVTSKFADYPPLYRREDIFRTARLCDFAGHASGVVRGCSGCGRTVVPADGGAGEEITRGGHRRHHLSDTQILLADAYGGYNGVVAGNAITRAGYWSHARRKFVDAEQAAPEIAREAVALLGKLFAVEKQGKDMDISVAERREPRQEQSVPVLAEREAQVLSRRRSGAVG
jgi:transposase